MALLFRSFNPLTADYADIKMDVSELWKLFEPCYYARS